MKYRGLDIRNLLLILKKRLLIVLLATALCGASAFAISKYLIAPIYTATTSMYVFNNRAPDQITSSDLMASQDLVNTYIVILKSNNVLTQVINKLNLNMTPEDIRRIMNTGAIDGTEAFKISITHSNANIAQLIANTIADTAPAEIIRVVKTGGAEVIDYAELPAAPSSPNIVMTSLAGVLIGFVLSFGTCISLVIFNTNIQYEEDVSQNFSIPILGCVPSIID